MSSIADFYTKQVHKKLGTYYGAWLPNESLKLGDYGVLDGDHFQRKGNIADFGITFTERPDNDPTPIDLVSESGVEFTLKFAGEANTGAPHIPDAKAGIAFHFRKSGAFIIVAERTFEPTIENIREVEDRVLELYERGEWHREWAVIVKMVTAPVATILISCSSESGIEIALDVDPTDGLVGLGKASLGFSVRWQSGDVMKMIGAANIAPLFQLAGIKSSGFLGIGKDVAGLRTLEPDTRTDTARLELVV